MVHSQYWPDLGILVDSSSLNEVARKIVWFNAHKQTKPPQSSRDRLRIEKQFQEAVKTLHAYSQKKKNTSLHNSHSHFLSKAKQEKRGTLATV